MKITDIVWPIYYIGQHDEIYTEYNVTYLSNKERVFIIDNKNLSGDTIGKRRLKLRGEVLYKFKKTLFMFSELVDFTRPKKVANRKFCDSRGNIFIYKKSKYVSLKCFPIHYVENFDTYKLIRVKGTLQSFKVPNNYYNPAYQYLSALYFGKYYALYDLSIEAMKNTWRKV
ncbi:MAG: hypothetical protein GY707_05295 [Desulfobacteraceae bacterium]|nr:hypothetical protein [Desulfobacteraceae bacterium]